MEPIERRLRPKPSVWKGGERDGAQSDGVLSHVVLLDVGLGGASHGRKTGWAGERRSIYPRRVWLAGGYPLLSMVIANNFKRQNPQISPAGGNL